MIQRVLAHGFRGLCAGRASSTRLVGPFCLVLLSLLLEGCTRPSVHEPVTLTILDWQYTGETFAKEYEREFQQFTKETGIQVRFLPSQDTPQQRLIMLRKLLTT